MTERFSDRPFWPVVVLGLLLLPFLFVMNSYSPPKDKIPEGYSSHILAFEFVSDKTELEEAINPLTENEIVGLDRLNYVDFGFMVLYGILLFLFMTKLGDVTDAKWLHKARWIAPAVVIFDVLENIQLLRLSHYKAGAFDPSPHISQLAKYTWSKWLLLAVVFALIGYGLLKMTLKSKWVGAVLLLPLILGVIAFISAQRSTQDIFASSVFGAFFILFGYSAFYKLKQKEVR